MNAETLKIKNQKFKIPGDLMEIYQHRGGLKRTLQAIKNGAVTLGFIGGSITDGRAEWNWPEPVAAWFVEQYPGVRVTVENAAIGATGSDLAVFRAQRDMIDKGCDQVFIEFAVNDSGSPAEQRMRSREGLIRKLLAGEGRDIVLTYTFHQPQYAEMMAGKMPGYVADFEQLGAHYHLGSVWMGLYALQEVMKGRMRWEEWLPDGLHPQHRGSLSYAQSVMPFLEKELAAAPSQEVILTGTSLPAPLNVSNWEKACALPFSTVKLEGPWSIRNWPKLYWIDRVLHTSAVGARLSFAFEGRGLLLGFDFGRTSAEFMYRLDGGDWQASNRDRPDWCGTDGWYRTFLVADDLPNRSHTFEMEVVHGLAHSDAVLPGNFTGTNINLGLIGILP
jgi:lysophospholipase L1-like esterase